MQKQNKPNFNVNNLKKYVKSQHNNDDDDEKRMILMT